MTKLMVARRRKADGRESRQFTVTIPAALVDAFGWKGGEELEVSIEGKGILRIREAK